MYYPRLLVPFSVLSYYVYYLPPTPPAMYYYLCNKGDLRTNCNYSIISRICGLLRRRRRGAPGVMQLLMRGSNYSERPRRRAFCLGLYLCLAITAEADRRDVSRRGRGLRGDPPWDRGRVFG